MRLEALTPVPFVTPWDGMPAETSMTQLLAQRAWMGITFTCPCGCGERPAVAFTNPLDGGPPAEALFTPRAAVSGTEWDSVSLTPAIDLGAHGQWFVHHGEVLPCQRLAET